MGEQMVKALTDLEDLRVQFRRDGIVKVKQMFDPELLAECRRCYDWSVANPGPLGKTYYEGTPNEQFGDFTNPNAHEMYCNLVKHPKFTETVAKIMGSEHVWYYSEEIFSRLGGGPGRTGWHQDTSYHPWGGMQWANVWISFDPLPAKNALEVVRGSHIGPEYDGYDFTSDPNEPPKSLHGGKWIPMPDIERERRENPEDWDIVSYSVEPGDAIILNSRCLHGGAPVDKETPNRRTLVLRFYGDDAFYKPLAFGAEYYIKGKDVYDKQWGHLQPGDPIRSPEFPQIR